jgi:hypothetical protein
MFDMVGASLLVKFASDAHVDCQEGWLLNRGGL